MDMYEVRIRTAVPRDMPGMVRIEETTFGSWNEREFERVLQGKQVDCYVAIAVNKHSGQEGVIGFLVMEFGKYQAYVINMAATWPEARQRLIAKAEKRADKHQLHLAWEES